MSENVLKSKGEKEMGEKIMGENFVKSKGEKRKKEKVRVKRDW